MKYLLLIAILLTGCLPVKPERQVDYEKATAKPKLGIVQNKTQRDGYIVPEEKDGQVVWTKHPPQYFIEISYDQGVNTLFTNEDKEVSKNEWDEINVGDAWFNGKHYPRPKDEE